MNLKDIRALASLVALATLAGCGGGGGGGGAGGGTTVQPPGGGTGGGSSNAPAGAVYGTVTGFGSIHVNGLIYDTSQSRITHHGEQTTLADLEAGHVVHLEVERDARGGAPHASQIHHDVLLRGPIESYDPATDSYRVLGHRVHIGADTADDGTWAQWGPGTYLMIDGHHLADGSVLATRIARDPASDACEIIGRVSSLDQTTRRLRIQDLEIDYSTAMLAGNDVPAVGQSVRVHGTRIDGSGTLIADRLERWDMLRAQIGSDVRMEGAITRYGSSTDFDVMGYRIRSDGGTRFVDGTAAELAVNRMVQIEGRYGDDGSVSASVIRVRRAAGFRAEGAIESIDVGAETLTIVGLTLTVDAYTRLHDGGPMHDMYLSLESIAVGDWIEVWGYADPADPSRLIATRLEREGQVQTLSEIVSRPTEIAPPSLLILGVRVATSPATQFLVDGLSVSAEQFFSRVTTDRMVVAEGVWDGVTLTASRLATLGPGSGPGGGHHHGPGPMPGGGG